MSKVSIDLCKSCLKDCDLKPKKFRKALARELEALEQAIIADGQLLDPIDLDALKRAIDALKEALQQGQLNRIEMAAARLKGHSNNFAAIRMNQHVDTALKGTHLNDWQK